MKRILFVIIFLTSISLGDLYAQYDFSLYDLGNFTPQANGLNPSFFPEKRFYIGFPAVSSVNLSMTNGFSFNQFFRKNDQGEFVIDLNYLADNLAENNYLRNSIELEVFSFGYQVKKNFFNIGLKARFQNDFDMPDGIINEILDGNGNIGLVEFEGLSQHGFQPDDGKSDLREIGSESLQINSITFAEVGLGYGRKVNDRLTLGVKVKFLKGMVNVESNNLQGALATNLSESRLSISTDAGAELKTTGVMALINDDNSNYSNFFDYAIKNKNYGFAFDFGASYQVNDYLHVSGSIIDLGFIHWKDDVENHQVNQINYTLDGNEFSDILSFEGGEDKIEDRLEDELDVLDSTFRVKAIDRSYRSTLASKMYLNGTFTLERHSVGLTFAGTYNQNDFNPGFSLLYFYQINELLKAGGTVGYVNEGIHNVGIAVALNLGPVQLYTTTDNLFGIVNVNNAKSANVHFGINLLFGKDPNKEDDE
ncbi:DUF5723 family protein [Aureibacter tunicatorum]|uniref:DUF5723 domain-containing protein n=1 Tax=Aureibacter tunicatorum TaxID=866807 RepID=A0AAE4BT85_9BACT|nr:DUF5723 family protein [Aureibacter tunicatorum]MDR6239292.1 hypothetical protein [Aureibacter tunicatorum]BDD04783.1 hypothetical protein AUTU_22660 [Aureibacter tunicatorum]